MSYPKVPVVWPNAEEHRRRIADAINGVMDGKINSVGSCSLETGTASTVISDVRCSVSTVPILVPTSQTAAQAEYWIESRTDGSFTVSHGTSTAATRTFLYLLMG